MKTITVKPLDPQGKARGRGVVLHDKSIATVWFNSNIFTHGLKHQLMRFLYRFYQEVKVSQMGFTHEGPKQWRPHSQLQSACILYTYKQMYMRLILTPLYSILIGQNLHVMVYTTVKHSWLSHLECVTIVTQHPLRLIECTQFIQLCTATKLLPLFSSRWPQALYT